MAGSKKKRTASAATDPRRRSGARRVLDLHVLPRVLHDESAQTREHECAQDVAPGPVLERRVEPRAEVELLDQRRRFHVEEPVPEERDECDQHSSEGAARDEPRRIEHPGRQLALLLLVPDPVGEALHHAADEDREGRREREVGADGPGERVRAGHLRHEGEEDAHEDGGPGQVLREQALDDRGHERGLRRRELRAADAVQLPDLAVRRVEEEQRPADHERRDEDPDDEADLLPSRRRAHEEPGLQVLRGGARVRGRDADEGPDAERDGLVNVARAADQHEHDARAHQGGDRHTRDRVRGRSDDADDAEDTVTKKNPKTMTRSPMRSEPGNGPCGKPGRIVMSSARTIEPPTTIPIPRSSSVLTRAFSPVPPRNDFTDSLKADTIVGSVFTSVMTPAHATAPAPTYRTYA